MMSYREYFGDRRISLYRSQSASPYKLVWHDIDAETDDNRGGIVKEIKFIDFNTAYYHVLNNGLEVHNIKYGSYEKEIAHYKKEILDKCQMRLF